jgi:Arc/MetJ family transcription regulator
MINGHCEKGLRCIGLTKKHYLAVRKALRRRVNVQSILGEARRQMILQQ